MGLVAWKGKGWGESIHTHSYKFPFESSRGCLPKCRRFWIKRRSVCTLGKANESPVSPLGQRVAQRAGEEPQMLSLALKCRGKGMRKIKMGTRETERSTSYFSPFRLSCFIAFRSLPSPRPARSSASQTAWLENRQASIFGFGCIFFKLPRSKTWLGCRLTARIGVRIFYTQAVVAAPHLSCGYGIINVD